MLTVERLVWFFGMNNYKYPDEDDFDYDYDYDDYADYDDDALTQSEIRDATKESSQTQTTATTGNI